MASPLEFVTEFGANISANLSDDQYSNKYLLVGEHGPALEVALEVLLTLLLAFVMLAMGCDITFKDVWFHLRRPTGILIGLTSQFLVLPACAFAIASSLQLTTFQTLSLLILSCCPGGVASNIFTMWCRGNVSLSICMTTASTFTAMGMMPLNLLVYTTFMSTTHDVYIPYDKMVTTLATILLPVVVGVCVKSRFPSVARYIIWGGTTAGFLAIVASIIIQSLLIPGLFDCGWETYFASVLLPLLGFFFGYIWAVILCMRHKECRTVAMETGSQNVPLALTIILLSFPFSAQKEMAPFPMLFAIFVHIEAITFALTLRWYFVRRDKIKIAKLQEGDSIEKNTML